MMLTMIPLQFQQLKRRRGGQTFFKSIQIEKVTNSGGFRDSSIDDSDNITIQIFGY